MKSINKIIILFAVFFIIMILADNNWGWFGILLLIISLFISKSSGKKSQLGNVGDEATFMDQDVSQPILNTQRIRPALRKVKRKVEVSRKIPRKGEIIWVPTDSPFTMANYKIAGAVYVTNQAERWGGESSAIDLNAEISLPAPPEQFNPSYYPTYSQLDVREKASYLEWLEKGMLDEDPSRRDVGYIFLYFYGIERRVFLDKSNDISLLERVEHLLRNYGPSNSKRTLVTYLSEFLHFAYYRRGEVYRNKWCELITLHEEKMSEMILKMILANLYQRGESLEWSLAYRIAKFHDDSKRSVVINRSGEKFFQLFQAKFIELYPNGLSLKAGKRDTLVKYRLASMSLDQLKKSDLTEYIPNVYGLASQFKKLPQIWNECVDELSGYSRAVRNLQTKTAPCDESSLKAFLALPEEIRSMKEHPMLGAYNDILSDSAEEKGINFVPVNRIAELLGIQNRSTLTASQSKKVSDLVESFGMTLAPHPLSTKINLRWEQEVAILDQRSFLSKDNDLVSGALRLMYLTVVVAAADGEVDEAELVFFRSVLENIGFNQSERVELDATLSALLRDTNIALKNLNKIAKSIKVNRRDFVFNHVLEVAAADEDITREEVKVLKRIGKAMGKSDMSMDSLISEKENSFKVVPVNMERITQEEKIGEAITKVKDASQVNSQVTNTFSLDLDKIEDITADTNEVIRILADVLSEEEVKEKIPVESTEVQELSEPLEFYEGLDKMYHKALQHFLSSTEWTTEELKQELKRYHLMQSAFVDAVNDWADEELGDFLIEIDGDRVIIYNNLLEDVA